MIKRITTYLLYTFALLLSATANDSIFVQLKSGAVLAYEYAENDTVSIDETYISVGDTTFFSCTVKRVTFDRSKIRQDSTAQFVSLKLRGSDAGNEVLLGKTFTASIDNLNTKDTILFNIPYLSSFKLTPYFVTSSQKAKVYVNDEEIISTENIIDFSTPVTMRIEQPGYKDREYTIMMRNSGLPIVNIETPNRKRVQSKSTWVENSSMVIYYPDGTVSYDSGTDNMNIRGRGNSTWSYSKKPYNIKLNSKKSILGMPKHKRWCLLANYIDRTLMRNAVAFELAKMTSMDWTPNGKFVELILNGEPLGNYYLCEAIRIDKNRVNINEMTIDDVDGEAITGGYLLELDSYYDAKWKFKTSYFRMPVNLKQPDDDEFNDLQLAYIKSYFDAGERELSRGSVSGFAEYFDMNNLIDWYLLNEAIHNPELSHPKSSYIHKDKNGKLRMGPAWDHDWDTFTPESRLINNNSMWFSALFQYAEFREMLKARWNVLKGPWSSITSFIDETREEIRASWEFNVTLWPNISNGVNGDISLPYDDAVNRMKNSFINRLNSLDAIINAL